MPTFFDTSVLVYAIKQRQEAKHEVAGELVQRYMVDGGGVVSVRVLRVFCSVSRRLANPLPEEQAQRTVGYFSAFDAPTGEASMVPGAERLLTEDLRHGQAIEGLRIEPSFLCRTTVR